MVVTSAISMIIQTIGHRERALREGCGMRDFRELVETRYSCRNFTSQPVERDKIDACIEAARLAPSACNAQPWSFVVVDEPERLDKAAAAAVSGIYRFSRFITKAPVLIAILADRGSFLTKAGSFVRNTRFYLLDIGIVSEHLVLQAADLGLGACHVGWFNEKALAEALNLPKRTEIPLLIALGYPEPSKRQNDPIRRQAKSDTRKSANEIVVYNP